MTAQQLWGSLVYSRERRTCPHRHHNFSFVALRSWLASPADAQAEVWDRRSSRGRHELHARACQYRPQARWEGCRKL